MTKLKAKETYLGGKSIFIVSLLVITITIVTVYLTGKNFNRSITSNLYISLSIIGTALFMFMTYGLYKGIGLKDNFPKFKNLKNRESDGNFLPKLHGPEILVGDGIGGILLSIVLWIVMSILVVLLLILLEAIFWFSLFIIITTLYWVFFRALKLVFSKSEITKGALGISVLYAFFYTLLYLGWIFGIVYCKEIFES